MVQGASATRLGCTQGLQSHQPTRQPRPAHLGSLMQQQRQQRPRAAPAPAAAGGGGGAPGQQQHSEHPEHPDYEKRMADASERAAAAEARYRDNAEVMERVDAVIESVPPSAATYTLRLLAHADDPRQAARENREDIDEEFFAALRAVLQSPAFKQATDASTPGNTRVLAAGVLAVLDGAWRAALEARQ